MTRGERPKLLPRISFSAKIGELFLGLARETGLAGKRMRGHRIGSGRVTLDTIHRGIAKNRDNQAGRKARGRYVWPAP